MTNKAKPHLVAVGDEMNTEPPVQHQFIIIKFRDGAMKEFAEIIGYQLGSGFIGVQMKNGNFFIYPSDLVLEVFYSQG